MSVISYFGAQLLEDFGALGAGQLRFQAAQGVADNVAMMQAGAQLLVGAEVEPEIVQLVDIFGRRKIGRDRDGVLWPRYSPLPSKPANGSGVIQL